MHLTVGDEVNDVLARPVVGNPPYIHISLEALVLAISQSHLQRRGNQRRRPLR